jgi:acetyl esterase/lipase
LTIAEQCAQYERARKLFPTPPEVKVERVAAPAEWAAAPAAAPGRVVLYLHGLLALRDARLPLPVAGVRISPWVDRTCRGPAMPPRPTPTPS